VDRAGTAAELVAPKAAPSSRRRGVVGLGVAALLAAVGAAPFAMVEIGTRGAAACVASYEAPREPVRPSCATPMDWFVFPSRLPFVPSARYRAEELGARIPMADYRDAAVGKPDREGLAVGAEAVLAAERVIAAGSQRIAFWDLGRAVGAPDLGRDAAELGDRRTLVSRGEAWLAWPVRLAALHAAVDEGDVSRAVELAKAYAGWDPRDEDLRAAVSAFLCLGDEPSRGMRMLTTLQDDRAKRKYAGMARDYGDVRAMIVACAARARVPAPPKPAADDAGRGDLVEARTVLRLRVASEGTDASGSALDAVDAAIQLLETAPRSARTRVHLLAGLAEVAVHAGREVLSTTLARLASAHGEAGEEPLVPSTLVTTLDLVDGAPGIVSSLPPAMLASGADRLAAAAKDGAIEPARAAKLAETAGAAFLEAARGFAQIGDAKGAVAAIDRAGELVLPGPASLLARAAALRAGGDEAEALAAIERATSAAAAAADGATRALRVAVDVEAAELLASLGRRDEAATRAARAAEVASGIDDVALAARARFTALALGRSPVKAAGPPPGGRDTFPWVGFADRAEAWRRPEPARRATLDASLAAWERALTAPAPERLSLRYELVRHRGDAPRWLAPHLAAGAALLSGAPGDAEVWLDTFGAFDARRFTHRAYAFARREAARWRGDRAAAASWSTRLAAMRAVAADPGRAEIARFLGI
jgi:hypothetical protein